MDGEIDRRGVGVKEAENAWGESRVGRSCVFLDGVDMWLWFLFLLHSLGLYLDRKLDVWTGRSRFGSTYYIHIE